MSDSRRRKQSTSAAQALIGSETPFVAGYRIERMLGEGGFGQVWRAEREDGSLVAIKILHPELVRSIDAMTRFERELSAIERLDHRNVVRAYDHGALPDGRPFLVLEYIEGPSLRDVINERGALAPRDMLAILEPLCEALSAAHAQGLVHRDVKASNVIIGHDAQGPRPVLLDFGLVKLLDQAGPGLTSSRNMLGTPAAMAPEQLRGQPVDARTDVYALGLLAYHMLTAAPAYGGGPGVVQTYLQVSGPRPRPSSKVDIDPAIDVPIGRALTSDPAGRFAHAIELAEALRQVIAPTGAGAEQDVVAIYIEAQPSEIARLTAAATEAGMTIAVAAPDSMLAVAGRDRDLSAVRTRLIEVANGGARVAMGITRASICGSVVDGPALDVEGWANYPLDVGFWIAPELT